MSTKNERFTHKGKEYSGGKRLLTVSHNLRVLEYTDCHGNRMINIGSNAHNIEILHAKFEFLIKEFAYKLIDSGGIHK